MAKEAKTTTTPESVTTEPSTQELMAKLQTALNAGDYKAVAQVSRQIDQRERQAEKAELEAKRAALEGMAESVKHSIMSVVAPLVESGELDKADGIWFAYDFGDTDATVRLTKSASRTPRAGGGTGKKFDISTDDMLSKHGEESYKDTGMTIRQAYDSNTDKNWRYAIRQALLKKEGII